MISPVLMFDRIDPVQWLESDRKVIKEVTPLNYKIDYQNPCHRFNESDLKNEKLFKWCQQLFDDSFTNPLEHFCNAHDVTRHERALPVIIGGAAAIVIGGVSYGIGKIVGNFKSKRKWNDLMESLRVINEQIKQRETQTNCRYKTVGNYFM
jgi:hypothetical protein